MIDIITLQMISPVARLPKAEPVHLAAAVAERGVAVGSSAQIQISQLFEVGADNLVGVDKDAAKNRKGNLTIVSIDFKSKKFTFS